MGLESVSDEIERTNPKSHNLMVQFELTRMLEGFRSLWITYPVCRYFKALVI